MLRSRILVGPLLRLLLRQHQIVLQSAHNLKSLLLRLPWLSQARRSREQTRRTWLQSMVCTKPTGQVLLFAVRSRRACAAIRRMAVAHLIPTRLISAIFAYLEITATTFSRLPRRPLLRVRKVAGRKTVARARNSGDYHAPDSGWLPNFLNRAKAHLHRIHSHLRWLRRPLSRGLIIAPMGLTRLAIRLVRRLILLHLQVLASPPDFPELQML